MIKKELVSRNTNREKNLSLNNGGERVMVSNLGSKEEKKKVTEKERERERKRERNILKNGRRRRLF